jgi:lactate permease
MAILPILVIFIGLVFLRISGTLMSIIGWLVTAVIAVLFFHTTPEIVAYASVNGILASFGISLMVLFTILQVTLMDRTGAIKAISHYIKTIAAERYEQIMILNVGIGSFLVSIGATPVTMLPPVMLALGFSPLAAVALPCLGYDPLTSFSLLAVPITLPATVFNLDISLLGNNIALFLPIISTGFALGMLWVADGITGVRKGFFPAIIAGCTLGFSCIFFVHILPPEAIGLVGVFSGLITIIVLFLLRVIQGKAVFGKRSAFTDDKTIDIIPLRKAVLPWCILVFFITAASIPLIQSSLYGLLGPFQIIHIVANKHVDLKIFNQAYFWVFISTIIAAPFLIQRRGETVKILAIWLKRALAPTFATVVYFAIAYIMDWSGQVIINDTLMFAPGTADLNMNAVIGLTLALIFGVAFPLISPLLGLLGTFVSGSETSSNVMFYGILKKSADVLTLDFMKVYAAHAVAGGIASGIAPAKIITAAAVIDQPGIEGEVIKKCAPVGILLTLVTGVMLVAFLSL